MAEAKKVTERTIEDIRKEQEKLMNERITYVARRPVGVDPKTKDTTVTINGYNYQIQYEVPVKIPAFVAEVLERAYHDSVKLMDKIIEAQKSEKLAEM